MTYLRCYTHLQVSIKEKVNFAKNIFSFNFSLVVLGYHFFSQSQVSESLAAFFLFYFFLVLKKNTDKLNHSCGECVNVKY